MSILATEIDDNFFPCYNIHVYSTCINDKLIYKSYTTRSYFSASQNQILLRQFWSKASPFSFLFMSRTWHNFASYECCHPFFFFRACTEEKHQPSWSTQSSPPRPIPLVARHCVPLAWMGWRMFSTAGSRNRRLAHRIGWPLILIR